MFLGVVIPVIDQIRGRRSRRPSNDQGPLNMKSPTKAVAADPLFKSDLPEIPAHEIFVPEEEEEVPFRSRASTIGNGQIPRLARKQNVEESSAELNKLDRNIDQSESALEAAEFNLKKIFPTFDKEIRNYLGKNDFDNLTKEGKYQVLESLLSILNNISH